MRARAQPPPDSFLLPSIPSVAFPPLAVDIFSSSFRARRFASCRACVLFSVSVPFAFHARGGSGGGGCSSSRRPRVAVPPLHWEVARFFRPRLFRRVCVKKKERGPPLRKPARRKKKRERSEVVDASSPKRSNRTPTALSASSPTCLFLGRPQECCRVRCCVPARVAFRFRRLDRRSRRRRDAVRVCACVCGPCESVPGRFGKHD